MFLENVTKVADLEHTYKVRAFAGECSVVRCVELGSFATERMDAYDYLENCGLSGDDDLRRAYILGTVVHEIGHRIYRLFPRHLFAPYTEIVENELTTFPRPQYVSDYVVRHTKKYLNDARMVVEEDLVESVRIFTTNPAYLRAKYPRRFKFIKKTLPFIQPGHIVKIVKSL